MTAYASMYPTKLFRQLLAALLLFPALGLVLVEQIDTHALRDTSQNLKAVWGYTEKLREQYTAELKKVAQLQKQWALRKPVLDAHCLTLQKEILRLEQEIAELVMEKIQIQQ